MRINLHNLIELDIDPSFPWLSDWTEALGDVVAMCASSAMPTRSMFRVVYHPHSRPNAARNVNAGFRVGTEKVLDDVYGVQLEASTDNGILLRAYKPAMEWLIWGMQLALLRAGATLVHCAALEKDGRAFLFPSWGGVGKTALVAEMVRSFGFRFLGDDMVIVERRGTCYGFPKPLVLYPYHRSIFPAVFNMGRGPIAPVFLNNLLTGLAVRIKPLLRRSSVLLQFARRHYPQRALVNPSEVFGSTKLAVQANIEAIVWIDRILGIEHPQYCEGNDVEMASRIFGSTMNEFDPRCVRLADIAVGLGIISAKQLYVTWFDVLHEVCSQAMRAMLYLPADLHLADVPGVVWSALEKHGVIR